MERFKIFVYFSGVNLRSRILPLNTIFHQTGYNGVLFQFVCIGMNIIPHDKLVE